MVRTDVRLIRWYLLHFVCAFLNPLPPSSFEVIFSTNTNAQWLSGAVISRPPYSFYHPPFAQFLSFVFRHSFIAYRSFTTSFVCCQLSLSRSLTCLQFLVPGPGHSHSFLHRNIYIYIL